MIGNFARSLAGHDKDKVYIIIREDTDFVWLVDGDLRGLDHPKRKNKKHIQIIKSRTFAVEDSTNEEIKRAILVYTKDIQEVR